MLKTVKNGNGIRVDPPCFFKIPTFSRFFLADVPYMVEKGPKNSGKARPTPIPYWGNA